MTELFRKRATARLAWGDASYTGPDVAGGWIGGHVVLTAELLAFVTSRRRRRATHATALRDTTIPLYEVQRVYLTGGPVTRTVVIELAHGDEFRFRCLGAADAAATLRTVLARR